MRLPKKRAEALTTALFLVALAVLVFTGVWWPGIMLAIGLPLALRQYFLRRTYDMCITLFVFVGTFITIQYNINWKILLPTILCVSAFFVILKEWIRPDQDDQK